MNTPLIHSIFGIVILVVIAYLATHQKLFHEKLPTWLKMLIASGNGMIILGIALGVSGLNFIDKGTFSNLSPIIQLLLAWVGIVFGTQFKLKLLKSFPAKIYAGAFGQAFLTFLFIGTICFFAAVLLNEKTSLNIDLIYVFAIAAIGCISSPTLLSIIIRQRKSKGELTTFLQATSSLDGIVGITLISIFFVIKNDRIDFSDPYIFIGQILLAIFLGLIFQLYVRLMTNPNEQFLLLIGMLTFTGGVAYITHLSPLFINMIIGFILCNDKIASNWLDRQLAVAERPFYMLLLVFLGSQINLDIITIPVLLLIIIYSVSFMIGKLFSTPLCAKLAGVKNSNLSYSGGALFYQGGITISMLLSFYLFQNNDQLNSQIILAIIVFGLFITGSFSTYSIHKALSIKMNEGDEI